MPDPRQTTPLARKARRMVRSRRPRPKTGATKREARPRKREVPSMLTAVMAA